MVAIMDKLNLFRRNRMMCEVKVSEVKEIVKLTQLEVYSRSIVDMQQNEIFANEYLNRPIEGSGFVDPGEFYSFAASHGMISEVDVCAIENILTHLPKQIQGKVFVNVHLSTLFSARWDNLLEHMVNSYQKLLPYMVLEISEREGLKDYSEKEVQEKILSLRDLGFLFAIDDLGIGYSGLTNLAIVKPDYVKIDRQLVAHIDTDPYRQHMMNALVEYWKSVHIHVIVEGIERVEEANFFTQLGAILGQGYLFHKPSKLVD